MTSDTHKLTVQQLQRTIAESKLAIDSLRRVIFEVESRLDKIEPQRSATRFSRQPVALAVVHRP